ncbi:hypothetical protein OHA25_05805 [Nonomuraea sp. NBC_00507]|uniref:hypothetical protein n=1 Tax=Nonomuraea sp. NBC_00507 TaxID=2976002 RepID=UPI002E19D772
MRDTISIVRLHGQACIDCGAVNKRLQPAGDVSHRGRLWRVVACDNHISRYKPPLGQATSPPAQGLDQEERLLTHDDAIGGRGAAS